MFDSFFYWIGTVYRDELYLNGAKIAGILCSYADICAVAFALRVMDIIRKRPPSKIRYTILVVFALATPVLLLPKTGLVFFIVQFVILFPPYLILMYTAFTEAKYFMAHVRKKCQKMRFEDSC